MKYVWTAANTPGVPFDWQLTDGGGALASLIFPLLDDAQTRIWLRSLLMQQFSSEAAIEASIKTLASVNKGATLPLDKTMPERYYLIPLDMLLPEVAAHFTVQGAPGGQNAPASAPVLSADASLSSVEPVQPGAYQSLNLAPGAQWSPEVYVQALTGGSGGGVFLSQPDIKYASVPFTDNPGEQSEPFIFLSQQFAEPDNPLLSIPVATEFYNRYADKDVYTPDAQPGARVILIASALFVLYQLLRARGVL